MILAAGLGTRLSPMTQTLPKPLVPVAGVPVIVRLLRHLCSSGIREIVINTHHLGDMLEQSLGDGSSHGVCIAYSRETELLGTGGGIRRALSLLGDQTFAVFNADALFLPDLEAMLARHRATGALATLVVREDADAEQYGAVGVDEQGRVRYLLGNGARTPDARSYMFTGTHVLEPDIAPYLPESGCIVRLTYQRLIESGAAMGGLVHGGTFFDLGTPARYLEANIAVVTGWAIIPEYRPNERGVHIGQNVSVAAGCRIGRGAVLCNGSSVVAGVSLERCVLMPGARATADLKDAILLADGTVIQPQACERS
jgi:NDP-sugar pyrophosphorylase family protein